MVVIDGAEIAKHNTRKSCWIEIEGVVWDVTGTLFAITAHGRVNLVGS